MEFNALAAKETSALLTRVLSTASQASLQKVDALRAALDAAAKALEASIADTPSVDQEVEEVVKRLAKAATADADARLKHLSAEARKITDALRSELAEASAEKEKLAASLKDARTDLDSTRAQLQSEQKQAAAFRKELSEVQAANKKLEAAKIEAISARDKQEKTTAAIQGEMQALRAQLDTAR